MSILTKIKDRISRAAQRGLGIDGVRFDLQVGFNQIQSKLAELESTSTRTGDQLQNLRSFLTWYSNRVEPWFWTGNFSYADPEEELAGLLFNFLPGRILVDLGGPSGFTAAAAEIGYQVVSVAPPQTITSPDVSKTLPNEIDFLSITRQQLNPETIKALGSIRPSVIQAGFTGDDLQSGRPDSHSGDTVSTADMIAELRKREYYWSVMVFRTDPDDFIRMGTNLASVPSQGWGTILFFRDYQLFLKAFHWCKTTLPRFRAAQLAK
jgi:hypothetical protein